MKSLPNIDSSNLIDIAKNDLQANERNISVDEPQDLSFPDNEIHDSSSINLNNSIDIADIEMLTFDYFNDVNRCQYCNKSFKGKANKRFHERNCYRSIHDNKTSSNKKLWEIFSLVMVTVILIVF